MEEEELNLDIQLIDAEVPKADIKSGVPSKEGATDEAPSIKIVDSNFEVTKDLIYEGLNTEDYESYLGNDVFVPTGGIEAMNTQRADNQAWYAQAGNMLGQAVVGEIIGGTIEGLGYLLDVGSMVDIAKGKETEWGNALSDVGKSLREGSQSSMPIYQRNEGSFDMSDSGWWFGNGVSVASSLSMLLPSMAATKALGFLGKAASKGAGVLSKTLDVASRMGKAERWMAEGISQAVVSRHIENSMEASGTFESAMSDYSSRIDPETGLIFDTEKATQLAADAAASNYRTGWAMLIQDIPQYLAIGKVFNPRTMKMEKALTKASGAGKSIKLKPWQQKVKGGTLTFGSEGFEESYQYYIAERGKLLSDLKAGLITEKEYDQTLSDKIGDEEMMSSAFWGGLGGNLFQAAGPAAQNLFKSKDRKSKEKNYAADKTKFLKSRGEAFSLMQYELAQADQSGDLMRREAAINEMTLGMTIEALESDGYDQHIEQLRAVQKMSEEERAAFQAEQGVELDVELFKQYIPRILATADKARERYLTHLNKNDGPIAAALARNDIYIDQFKEKLVSNETASQSIKKNIPGYNKMSEKTIGTAASKIKIKAMKEVNRHHANNLKTAGKLHKPGIKTIIDENLKKIAKEEKKIADFKGAEVAPEQKESDALYRDGLDLATDELLSNEIENAIVSDAIQLRQKESKLMRTDDYKKNLAGRKAKSDFDSVQTKEDVEMVKNNILNSDFDSAERVDLLARLAEKEKAIDAKIKSEVLKARKTSHDEEIGKDIQNDKVVNPESLSNESIAEVSDNYEDSFEAEESSFTQPLLDRYEEAKESNAKTFKAVKLLDETGTEDFNEWAQNGKSKSGTKVRYEIGDPVDKNAADAIADFESGNISENTYHFLPIKVVIDTGVQDVDIHTFLPANTPSNTHFETNELPQRRVIIDLLKKDGKAESEILSTTGGDLITDDSPMDEGVPSNSIADLVQNKGKNYSELDIILTNQKGQVVNKFKEAHELYKGKVFLVQHLSDASGAYVPYKGGVFLSVTKADGSKFPLRLNLARHTRSEAELMADLLIEVGVKKTIKLDNPLSTIDPEFAARIKENHPEVVEVLGRDPKISDIINLFTYVSDQTKGLASELYISGVWVKFADGVVNPENLNDPTSRENLVNFLETKKRRQFHLKSWNENEAYRTHVIDQKIISTNATVDGPLFQSSDDRKISFYVKRINEPAPSKKFEPTSTTKIKLTGDETIDAKIARSEKAGIEKDEDNFNKLTGYYFGKFGATVVEGKSVEEIRKKIEDMYAADVVTIKSDTPKVKNSVTDLSEIESERQAELGKVKDIAISDDNSSSAIEDAITLFGANDINDLKQYIKDDGIESVINYIKNNKLAQYRDDQFSSVRKYGVENTINDIVGKSKVSKNIEEINRINTKYDAKIAELTSKSNTPKVADIAKDVVSSPKIDLSGIVKPSLSSIEEATSIKVEEANKKDKLVSKKPAKKTIGSPFGAPKVLKKANTGPIKKNC